MRVDEFDFELPEELIALRPASPRDSARLLVVDSNQALIDHHVTDLADLLNPGDALVFNNTRVIKAQLEGIRYRDGVSANVSFTLHMRKTPDRWAAFAKGAKKLKAGDRIEFGSDGSLQLSASILSKTEGGEVLLEFDCAGPALDEALAQVGSMPLPPYIAGKRPEDSRDASDYQTIYAAEEGAVAAPTAGLHFTPGLFDRLDEMGIARHFVTLHVGAGTFLPVKVDDTDDHKMHAEWGSVSAETAMELQAVRDGGKRVIAVGTTSLRLLESALDSDGRYAEWSGETDIFITPGRQVKSVDGLMTNFHLPRSTLFMLVSALAGTQTMQKAYAHAIKERYRFYSYGDASLILPNATDPAHV
ncbi:MAG: tRNA preQ1(34) S-adenosylmethionine ribosyltransferase-isomerase QueA [Pseudomonadota bacterium]